MQDGIGRFNVTNVELALLTGSVRGYNTRRHNLVESLQRLMAIKAGKYACIKYAQIQRNGTFGCKVLGRPGVCKYHCYMNGLEKIYGDICYLRLDTED